MPGDSAWLSLLWVFLCVVVIIGLAYYFTRFVAGRNGLGGLRTARGGASITVLARVMVGKEQSLLLVQAGERYFLLGAAPGGVTALAEFSKEEAEAWTQPVAETAGGQALSFKEALQTVINQRKQR